MTWLVWAHERQTAHEQLRGQFDSTLRDMASRIEQRIATYEQILRGVQSLFATVGITERDRLSAYVAALQPDVNFSGIQAIGVAELVTAERKDAHIQAMRRHGFADYDIWPKGARAMYTPIIQREPHVGLNRAAPGSDPWSDPVRREAMEKARDSGMATISGKLSLFVDAGQEAQPGFVMYLPIFPPGQPHDTVAQRRANLAGWVFASFRAKDIMSNLYGEPPLGIAFSLYDGIAPSEQELLYGSPGDPNAAQATRLGNDEYLVVSGHSWTLSARALDTFESRFGRTIAPLIAGGGTALSLLLAALVWLMATGRARALHLAETMTKDLRAAILDTKAALDSERQALREQRNFLAMVSHEFRTPLSIIDSAAQMLEFKGSLEDAADIQRVDTIRGGVRRLVGIIDTCLAEDRLESASGRLSLLPTDIGALLGHLLDEIRPSHGARQISLHHEPALEITGDPNLLGIALSNLVDNALKFSPSTEPVEVNAVRADAGISISVSDHGPGICPEDRPRIFEKFYRSPKTDRVHGAGLGLYLVKRIIDQHGGELRVESPPNTGATFIVWLPAAS